MRPVSKIIASLAFLVCSAAATVPAFADPVADFTFSAKSTFYGSFFDNYDIISGSGTYDPVTGMIETISGTSGSEAFSGYSSSAGNEIYYLIGIPSGVGTFILDSPLAPGNVDFLENGLGSTYSGTVTAYAPTPEPSSLILLGTGALSLAGAARRRFKR